MMRSASSASLASSSRSGPNTRTEMSAGVPPRPSSIRMPSGVVNSTAMPGRCSSRSRMSSSIAARSRARSAFSVTSTSDSVCGIGSSVRSARPVRRTTSSISGTSRRMSSTRWFRRSTSSSDASFGSTVCSRNAPSSSCGMKSLPTSSRKRERRSGDEQRHGGHDARVPQAAIEERRVARLDPPQQRHVVIAAIARGPQHQPGRDGHHGHRPAAAPRPSPRSRRRPAARTSAPRCPTCRRAAGTPR